MSIGIPHTVTKDWRELVAQDQANNRRIQLKNIERDTREAGPMWKDAQMKTYPQLLDITPDVPLEKIISDESKFLQSPEESRALAYRDLVEISSPATAEYILDRLEPREILYLLINLKGIVYNMKKRVSRMDKDLFVDIVKKEAEATSFEGFHPADLSEAGYQKLDLANELGRQNEARLLDEQYRFNQGVEEQNRQSDLYAEGNRQLARDAENHRRKLVRQERRARREQIQELPTPNIFGDLELDIRMQRLFGSARQKKQEIDDARIANAQDAPPVTLGSADAANISSPPSISPVDKGSQEVTEKKSTGKKQKYRFRARKNLEKELIQASNVQDSKGKGGGGGPTHIVRGLGIIYGRGSNIRASSMKKRFYFEKYYVELDKLASNTLSVKYARTDAYIPTLKVQQISNKVKELIQDVMQDDYDERIFKLLSDDDKRVFKRFVKALHLDLSIQDDLDEKFQKEYEILLGEFNSGNDSPEVKKALKKYVIEGFNEGKLSRHQAYFLLYQLSL